MDDFVREKLIEWNLSELMEKFEGEGINTEVLYCLADKEIDELIPKIGTRVRFKKRLKLLQEEEHTTNWGIQSFPAQTQQHCEEETHRDDVHFHALNTTFPSTTDIGKRKMDLQGESSKCQPAGKRKRESVCFAELKMFSDVKNLMEDVNDKLDNQENTKVNEFLRSKIRNLETDKRELVGVFGKTGAGKTSLINAVIEEKGLLPSGSVSACTSVMIKVEANRCNQKYEAEIEFITKEEWEDELSNIDQFHKDDADQESDDDDNDEYHDLVEKLLALYGEDWKQKSTEQLMDQRYFREIPEFLKATRKTLACESSEELSAKIMKYTRSNTRHGEYEVVKRWFWPLVKCVTVRVPHNDFLQHVTLVDLPGNGDRNKNRDEMWKEIVGNCSTVWIVTEINRAASEKESWEILKSASSHLGNGGECRHIHFICTKTDIIEELPDQADTLTAILKRNMEAKKLLSNEFKKLTTVKKHFSDDYFEVFTVSSKAFVNKNYLSPKNSEIPKLQEFLQILNDKHSEMLNYLSGAHGILSLIQGARSRNMDRENEDVCIDLQSNLSHQTESITKKMEESFKTLEICLQVGVKKSQQECTDYSILKPFLHSPTFKKSQKSGCDYYPTLKKVVEYGGTWKPKKGKEINLNMKLISSLTDSIDEEFRKTFPNDGKCGPFNGVIKNFSLDTERLTQKYSDVELQLIFLKSEEEQMKTKLIKLIRNRKKNIYRSLTKTIEEMMQVCYDEAAGISGPGSVEKIKKIIWEHVQKSKSVMFETSKDAMLGLHRSLMIEILETLENTMKESIELSLNIDDHSLPDVSEGLRMVQKLQDKLLKSS